MAFFQKKTGVDWEDRVIMQKTTNIEYFQYTPPVRFEKWNYIERWLRMRLIFAYRREGSQLAAVFVILTSTASKSMPNSGDFHGHQRKRNQRA